MLLERIETKLNDALSPVHLQVENESYMHNVPAGSESHFKVVVVSDKFAGQRPLARHRMVNEALIEEYSAIHALSIHAYTPEEWREKSGFVAETPKCLGGNKQ